MIPELYGIHADQSPRQHVLNPREVKNDSQLASAQREKSFKITNALMLKIVTVNMKENFTKQDRSIRLRRNAKSAPVSEQEKLNAEHSLVRRIVAM